ncbi:MAG: hypothetical protein GF350_12250 [Chitinivibrionales bacterium]|nr:hypothetical protein [Chitinivibrionales bacterium]
MKLSTINTIVRTLNDEEVRYIIVGGLAVVVHGYGRLTIDLDMVLKLEYDNIIKAFRALKNIGYFPRVPIKAEEFADRKKREWLIEEKDMKVLNFFSDNHRETPIDIFVQEPFNFDETYEKACLENLEDGEVFRYADIDTLILMKQLAGREKDHDDITHLNIIRNDVDNDREPA